MPRAADEFRSSDLRVWGLVAAAAAILALLATLLPAILPANTLAGLHASHDSRSATYLAALHAQLAELAMQQQKLSAASADLTTRIELAEQTVGAMVSPPAPVPVAAPVASPHVEATGDVSAPASAEPAKQPVALRPGAPPEQHPSLIAATATAHASIWPVPAGVSPNDAPKLAEETQEAPSPIASGTQSPIASGTQSPIASGTQSPSVAPPASQSAAAGTAVTRYPLPTGGESPVAAPAAAVASAEAGPAMAAVASPAARTEPLTRLPAEATPPTPALDPRQPAAPVAEAAKVEGPDAGAAKVEAAKVEAAKVEAPDEQAARPAAAPVVPLPVSAEPASAQAPRHMAAGNVRAVGVAIGQPVSPADALRTWQGLAAKIGIMLVGMSPLLAEDPAGSPGKVLVAGPVVSIGAATTLCARIDHEGISCMPMPYVGSDLAAGSP